MAAFEPREWATRTVNWQPARTAIKRAVHTAADARGRLLERRGDVPTPSNILAAGPQKAGSQWIKALFDHPLVRSATGLMTLPQLDYQLTPPRHGFPAATFVPGYYGSYQELAALPQRGSRKVVYLGRDPRTMVVSGYWSAVETHRPTHLEEVEDLRTELRGLPMEEALVRLIHSASDLFATMETWIDVADPDVARFRLEDVATDAEGQVGAMFEHCGIRLSEDDFATVLRETSRDALRSKDLAHRKGDTEGHYRSRPSDYREVFTPVHYATFEEVAPGLVARLGYPPA
ncbi:MAG: sulfotransferase domain-containing protein [Nocardioidaceae bacterium]|nr:sulfotransferase domain-containing protein [Nocardioidaceae bacterium]MCL2614161.1 sulfotransferase domain-containing protein [Nocardioidaceae bacterium]